MPTLEGKIALVTGGSRGIGRAICRRLAHEGASILLHYNQNRAAAQETAALIATPIRLLSADLANPASIDALFDQLADVRLDVLINNAGIWRPTPLGATSAAALDEIIAVNLRAPFHVAQRALPLLNDGARIVNISSVAAKVGVAGGRSLYGATKAALESFTRNWALELAPRRILVNAIAPGYIETDMTAEHFSDPAVLKRALDRHPLGRMGQPDDVADTVAFLCSEDARFITGQTFNVSGGFVI
jgi:NAD(P)-dependent dehydrogenase (short-subunit alcohol dehydrogenase family)